MSRNGKLDTRRLGSSAAKATSAKSPALFLFAIVISTALALGVISYAHPKEKSNSKANGAAVDVDNFGQVTDFYYRGAQPKGEDYNQLATIGVKTIIDLRDDPKDYAKSLAEQAGMKYVNLPLSDKDYPPPDTASKFLSLVNDKENWPVYVHCAGGRHRTGAMTAVFRMTIQGWDAERAYDEMKDYEFYTRFGHKAMKRYVFDYYRGMKQAENITEMLTPAPKLKEAAGDEQAK
jgi:protein tyrosine/serine phosphatase